MQRNQSNDNKPGTGKQKLTAAPIASFRAERK
jgi:hypothetical protein